ncbi:MFS transporter permease [Microbacterium sp. bgisy207]|uniref:MFS transporter permease n=1 Tax=Microbacterium sp. bgisy207 TaxID=3413800 RepID=UPI003EBC6D3E
MWLRRAFYGWMIPAAFVLPLWLFVGWIAFDAGAWALLWVLLVAIPSVLIGQLVLTLLVRARPTARAARAVSWWDVAGFAVWHALTFALGFFVAAWWLPVFLLTVAVGISLFWLMLWQLWREARPGLVTLRSASGIPYIPPSGTTPPRREDPEVIVITEQQPRS